MIATGLCQAQLLVLEKPGNALPSPISLPTQPNALRSRIDYYLLTPLSVRSLSKIAHIRSVVSVLLSPQHGPRAHHRGGPPRDVATREPKQRHYWDALVVLHDQACRDGLADG